jgi:Fe-S-cluster containining protein
MNAIDCLCPNCGLCCDGALFADVELRLGDDAKQLARLGLTIAKKGRRKLAFAQPCACFDGKYCKIYRARPGQCRLFECALLKKTGAGEMSTDAALEMISEAKTLANRVRTLLRALGQRSDKQAMTHCYAEAMTAPIDLSCDDNVGERHGQLMRAFGDLMELLEREFLQ